MEVEGVAGGRVLLLVASTPPKTKNDGRAGGGLGADNDDDGCCGNGCSCVFTDDVGNDWFSAEVGILWETAGKRAPHPQPPLTRLLIIPLAPSRIPPPRPRPISDDDDGRRGRTRGGEAVVEEEGGVKRVLSAEPSRAAHIGRGRMGGGFSNGLV